MPATTWQVSGHYYETCSCDFRRSCLPDLLSARPADCTCTFAMTFQIERGHFGSVSLDGLSFILVGFTPGEMGKDNWSVGVIADERADEIQQEAIAAIAIGVAGGPMSALAPFVGDFLGVQAASIRIQRSGNQWSVRAGELVDVAADAALVPDPDSAELMYLENTGHPAANRFALAHAQRSHVNALGLRWNDTSGRNNGQFAPFQWCNS